MFYDVVFKACCRKFACVLLKLLMCWSSSRFHDNPSSFWSYLSPSPTKHKKNILPHLKPSSNPHNPLTTLAPTTIVLRSWMSFLNCGIKGNNDSVSKTTFKDMGATHNNKNWPIRSFYNQFLSLEEKVISVYVKFLPTEFEYIDLKIH